MKKIKFLFLLFGLVVIVASKGVLAQGTEITGKVINEKEDPLPGVNVVIKGTTQGEITDSDGEFSIMVPEMGTTLRFSFVGYQTKEVVVNQKDLLVKLKSKTIALDQVVAIGYGSAKRKDLTSSIESVESEDIQKSVNAHLASALQGKVSGVSVQKTGEPGRGSIIKIRGPGSFSNNSPLYVIDGVPVDGTIDFNVDNIESVDILKDASAASIYGSRAANGVILISTKEGKKGEQ